MRVPETMSDLLVRVVTHNCSCQLLLLCRAQHQVGRGHDETAARTATLTFADQARDPGTRALSPATSPRQKTPKGGPMLAGAPAAAAPPGKNADRSGPSAHPAIPARRPGLRYGLQPPQDRLESSRTRMIKRWLLHLQHRHATRSRCPAEAARPASPTPALSSPSATASTLRAQPSPR